MILKQIQLFGMRRGEVRLPSSEGDLIHPGEVRILPWPGFRLNAERPCELWQGLMHPADGNRLAIELRVCEKLMRELLIISGGERRLGLLAQSIRKRFQGFNRADARMPFRRLWSQQDAWDPRC